MLFHDISKPYIGLELNDLSWWLLLSTLSEYIHHRDLDKQPH